MLGPARNMSFPSRRIKLKNTYNSRTFASKLLIPPALQPVSVIFLNT